MNRYQFVDDHQRRHGVKRLCDILGLTRSSFYTGTALPPARAARKTGPKPGSLPGYARSTRSPTALTEPPGSPPSSATRAARRSTASA